MAEVGCSFPSRLAHELWKAPGEQSLADRRALRGWVERKVVSRSGGRYLQ